MRKNLVILENVPSIYLSLVGVNVIAIRARIRFQKFFAIILNLSLAVSYKLTPKQGVDSVCVFTG